MIPLKKSIYILFFVIPLTHLFSQKSSHSFSPIHITSTTLDTTKVNANSIWLDLLWLNDTIRVRIQNDHLILEPDLIKALRKTDSEALRKQEDMDKFLLARKIGAQNCYSYALEKYFENEDAFSQSTFRKSTTLDRKSAEKILNNNFKEIAQLSVNRKKSLKTIIPNKVLLAFINKSGWAIHFVYFHNNTFYSKNGALKPVEFKYLNKFLRKHYVDTQRIILYKLDEDKVKQNL